jgi:uncharacterized Zn-binding protein involved in type VI secretion
MELAARVNDPVAHAGKLGGGILGAIIGGTIAVAAVAAYVIFAPVTVPVTAVVVVGGSAVASGISAGWGFGKLNLSKPFKSSGSHDIITGAATVHIGEALEKAARISDKVKCHSGKTIVVGSFTVFIERWNASRKGDETECAGKISDGCHTVMIGGAPVARSGYGKRSETAGLPDNIVFGIDIVGSILGLWGITELKSGAQIVGLGLKWGSGAKQKIKIAEIAVKMLDKAAPDLAAANTLTGDALKLAKIGVDIPGAFKNPLETTKAGLSLVSGGAKTQSTFGGSGDPVPTYDDILAAKAGRGP